MSQLFPSFLVALRLLLDPLPRLRTRERGEVALNFADRAENLPEAKIIMSHKRRERQSLEAPQFPSGAVQRASRCAGIRGRPRMCGRLASQACAGTSLHVCGAVPAQRRVGRSFSSRLKLLGSRGGIFLSRVLSSPGFSRVEGSRSFSTPPLPSPGSHGRCRS